MVADMLKKGKALTVLIAAVAVTLLVNSGNAATENGSETGPFGFNPIQESANSTVWNRAAPWKLPKGFTQTIVSDETDLDIYDAGRNDWPDMNTVNESGALVGRFLYRTHDRSYRPEGGSISVIDLKTGVATILIQNPDYKVLDGIRWTPWNTILIAEEITGGRLFEIILNDDMVSVASIKTHPSLGLLAHEGLEVDSDGNVYVVDEHHGITVGCEGVLPCGGSIYKFVPKHYGDLSAGSLYVLKVTGADGVGQGEWVGPIDPVNARISGSKFGGQSYQRPEDLEIIADKLYVAITEGPPNKKNKERYESRVVSINLKTLKVNNFIKPGVNVPVEIGKPGQRKHQTGWDNVDNLAETPDGKLVIIEDNQPSDIWVATTRTNQYGLSKGVWLFASLSDPRAEGTGIYFGKDPYTLYVNVQHSAASNGDATWAITKTIKHQDGKK